MITNYSNDYQLFLDSFEIKNRQSSEDYDIEALFRLNATEQATAENLLITTLETSTDERVPRALNYLKSTKAIPALQKAIKSKKGVMLVECALALWFIVKDDSCIQIFITLLKDENPDVRIAAAAALHYFDNKEVEKALCNTLSKDSVNLVRANCLESLYKIYGLLDWDLVAGRGVGLLRLRLSSDFNSIRQEAIKELIRVGNGKKEGKTAIELGLTIVEYPKSDAVKNVLKSFASPFTDSVWGNNFDLEALSKLEGEEKEWALYTLFFLLQRGDYRAVRALTHLKSNKAIEPFRELLKNAQGKMATELNIGITALSLNLN